MSTRRCVHFLGRMAYSPPLWLSRGSLFLSSDNHPVTSMKIAIAPVTMKSRMRFSTGMTILLVKYRDKVIPAPPKHIDMSQFSEVLLGRHHV
jgi:hypothetical protein